MNAKQPTPKMNPYLLSNLPGIDPRLSRVLRDLVDRNNQLALELESVRRDMPPIGAKKENPIEGIITIPSNDQSGFIRVSKDGVIVSYANPTSVSSSANLITVRKNSGADVGTRSRLNFIEGTNVTMTIADDAGSNEIDITINSSGGGGASLNTDLASLDFGSLPGKSDTSVNVTGQGAILANSAIWVWIAPIDTADHTIDEHVVEPLEVYPRDVIAGTGFTIHGISRTISKLYGVYNVGWAWY